MNILAKWERSEHEELKYNKKWKKKCFDGSHEEPRKLIIIQIFYYVTFSEFVLLPRVLRRLGIVLNIKKVVVDEDQESV